MKIDKFSSKKDKKKIVRSICQGIILVIVFYLIITALFTFHEYEAYDKEALDHQGFIAISYFGVDITGSDTLISTARLEKHLKALKNSGYVTITQQDILDYYKKGKQLPGKSLFLMFEDGRRDTAIFAQKIMEKYNFKATMLTYADKFQKKDYKFLMPDDLLDLEKSTYWELGTNGYRLSYINVFDRYQNYIGELDSLQYATVSSYLDRNYNHYLMDYIRDENNLPKESYNEMKERIAYDYATMEKVYTKELGRIPALYTLMHSNTGQFGTNDKTSGVNEENIYKLYTMNFNREGFSLNTKDSSIYDLTRMQPQSYWYTNHLLMRIWDDTGQEVDFVVGDKEKAKEWEILVGEAEFKKNSIILTSMPKGRGLLCLKEPLEIQDLQLTAHLQGNKLGSQAIYIRADEKLENYIYIQIKNNILHVKEKIAGIETELFSLNLDNFDGTHFQSVEENRKGAEIAVLKTKITAAYTREEKEKLKKELKIKTQEKVASLSKGVDAYIPAIELKEAGNRYLQLAVKNDKISISLDGKEVVADLVTKHLVAGSVLLEAAWGEYGYSQRNLVDDVYDGVFKELVVKEYSEKKIIFDGRLHGWNLVVHAIEEKWHTIMNWFIKTL